MSIYTRIQKLPPFQRNIVNISLGVALALGILVFVEPWYTEHKFRQEQSRAVAGQAPAIITAVNVFATDIYKTVYKVGKLPVALAINLYIDFKAKDFINDKELQLPKEVQQRLLARLDSDEFVDAVIPFLFALKTQYMIPDTERVNEFEQFVRTKLARYQAIAGSEHKLFSWKKSDGAGTAFQFKLDKKLVAQMIKIYDAAFLQPGGTSPIHDDQNLSQSVVDRTEVQVEHLLHAFLAVMKPKPKPGEEVLKPSDMVEALEYILADKDRVETLTITLIEGIRYMVSKNYRMFYEIAIRRNDLKNWLTSEFNKPGGGKFWDYLRHANNQRRYGMHVVVDGLEGHLVESLSAGDHRNPFIQSIVQLHQEADAHKPKLVNSSPTPAQKIDFLNYFSRAGHEDPTYLSYFKDLYRNHNEGIARFGISSTPTISVRNLPIAKTGAPTAGPGGSTIPNFHFVDRSIDRAYYFWGNDALQLEPIGKKNGMRSMFERLHNLNTINCNGTYDMGAKRSFDGFLNIAIGERLRDFGDLRCYLDLKKRMEKEKELYALRAKILQSEARFSDRDLSVLNPLEWIASGRRKAAAMQVSRWIEELSDLEDQGMPQYFLYYNPWPDHFAHFYGPFSDEIISATGELNRLNYWLTKFSNLYKEAGLEERTLFGMAGDHGLTPVFHTLNPETMIFDKMTEEGTAMKAKKISADEGEGPKMNRPWPPFISSHGFDVVVASTAGGNYMLDFFKDQGDGWKVQPVLRELRSLKTLAGKTIDVVKESLGRLGDSLDYLVVRDETCTLEGGRVRVFGPRQGQVVEADIIRRGDKIYYHSIGDLLSVMAPSPFPNPEAKVNHQALLQRCVTNARANDPNTWCDRETWRTLTSSTPRPDSVAQLAHLYDTDRAGTINLFPAYGVGYNTKVPGRHAGETFHEKDAFTGLWGHPVNASKRLITAENGSIAPTIYEFLVGSKIQANDGWGFPALTKQIREGTEQ